MKTKRFVTMLLAALMVLQLLPAAAQAAVVSESTAYTAVTELEAGRAGAPENSIEAINNFSVVGGKISFDLDVAATLSTGVGSDGSTIDAVVMSAADYVGANHGNSPTKVNNTNFNSATLLQVAAGYWRSGTAVVSSGKATFASMGANLTFRPMAVDNHGSLKVTENDCYYDDYVLILFNAGVGAGVEGRYVVKKFQVDSEGNLKTDSYMVRYVKNTASMGTTAAVGGTVKPEIVKPSSSGTTLTTSTYSRTGYTFMGWDEEAKFLENKFSGKTGSELANLVGALDDATAKADMDYPVGGATAIAAQAKDSIYNLYAQWRPNAVKFDTSKADTVTATGGTAILSYMTEPIPVLTLPSPRVNESYSQTGIALAASPTDGQTDKTYAPYSGKPLTLSTGETITTSSPGTYGLSVTADGKTAWKVTGTPQVDSKGQDVYILMQVQDSTNGTQDWIVIHFEEVKKGKQPIPTLDANTGLESGVETVDGKPDGQIYGFYSPGPKKGEDTGYLNGTNATNGTNGTGTMTEYYFNLGMVYEYRPVRVGTQEITWADGDSDKSTTAGYEDMPNGGWREMPFPSGRYNPADLAKIQAAGEKNGKTLMYSTLANGADATKAVVTDKTNDTTVAASEVFKTDGWLDSYGWIEFDENGLPVIHGLAEDDEYEVRFRANETFDASNPQTIKIGGAIGGGESGGSGLAVNLAGGKWKDADKAAAEAFVNAAAALKEGGTLALPEIEPERDGSAFLGWTLGERDSDGRLILYRRGTAVTPPEKPENVTVTWKNGATGETISHTVTSVPKGTEVPEEDYPEPPADVDKDADGEQPAVHKTFDKWTVSVDEETGNITITATYKDKPEVTYIWADPLKDGEDKTMGTPFTGYNPPAKEQYPTDPVHEGGAPFREWVMGEAVKVPVEGSETGETRLQVTFTATYKEKATYIWVDPLKDGEDKTVENAGWTNPSYDPPTAEQHPAAPDHGEGHPFDKWVMGEPVKDEETGVTTVTITATYKEKITYIWVDPEIKGEEGQEPPSQVVKTADLFKLTDGDYPAAPSHPGMDFKGWERTESEDGKTVTFTATYGQKVTYVWVDPLKDGEDKTVTTMADQFEKPEDPEAPAHEGWTFTGWTVGEPVTDETGVTTVTITATYEMEKWTYRDTLPAIEKFPASLAAVWEGGSGGGGLAVNLAGGHWLTEDEGAGQSFTADCAALQPGDSITIPDITPVRENYRFAGWTLGGRNAAGEPALLFAGEKVTLGNEAASLAAVWNSTPDGFVTIVCYDWDETLLGSVTVPKGASEAEVAPYMTRFVQSLQSPESKDRDTSKTAFFVDDKNYPMTYKRGYSFLCWLPNDSELPTHCGWALNGDNVEAALPEPTDEEKQSFANLQSNIIVKACYKDNSELYHDTSSGVGNLQYTIKQSYSRIGTSPTYTITVRVRRERVIDGVTYGVPRLVDPQLRATYTISNNNIFNFFALGTGDDVEFTIYPSTAVTIVSCQTVDFYGAANKTGASAKSNTMTTPYYDASKPKESFRVLGNVGEINELLAANDLSPINNTLARTGAGLTYTSISSTRTALRTAWEKKNSLLGDGATLKDEKDWDGLTWDEMQHAIDTGGGWPIS